MKQVATQAVIYKITHYSDYSAIAYAFSPEYGKIKLFMPRAYSGKGGFMTFVPGNLSFQVKDSSDLHRFVSFSHNPEYYFYTQTPEIMMRLSVAMDFFDSLFQVGEGCRVLWSMICRFDMDNYRKAGLYTIYRLMKEAGVMFSLVCGCGKLEGEISLINGELYCMGCDGLPTGKCVKTTADQLGVLAKFSDNELFRELKISAEEEETFLKLFEGHVTCVYTKSGGMKSLNVFFSMHDIQPDLMKE